MVCYIVTRHPGAVAWLRSRGYERNVIPLWGDADTTRLQPGDVVIGVLPIPIVAKILARGARFILMSLPNLAFERRGKELTPAEMEAAGASLLEILSLETRAIK